MLLMNRTLLKLSKGLWGWMAAIAGLKMVTLIGAAAFAKTISGFLGNIASPSLTVKDAGAAILSALAAGPNFSGERRSTAARPGPGPG